ncbi:MAG: ATP-binding protein [Candidatus Methanomethylophilaceae archaeon]|nr:ATP-binding protein [Candidatus Methanomethylophilaceae archaeon]
MKLRSISVYGLFGEYDYELQLSDGPLTYVHSQNGFGKSTIMKIVFGLFSGDLEEVAGTLFDRVDIGFSDNTVLIAENRNSGLLVQMQRNEVEEEITVDDLKNVIGMTYLSPDRLTTVTDGCMVPSLGIYVEEMMSLVRGAKGDSALVKVPKKNRKECSDAELEFWCKDLKAKLEFIKQAGFEPDMPQGFRFPPTRYEIMQHREEYLQLASSLEEYVLRRYALAESVIVFMDIVNGIFLNKTVFINESGLLSVRMDSGAPLTISKLSSGEKQILVIFYRLLFQTAPGSLVIIDEPEMSLHISWQQQIGQYFKDVAKLRDLQMIVATHSPQIIHEDWESAAELKAKDV